MDEELDHTRIERETDVSAESLNDEDTHLGEAVAVTSPRDGLSVDVSIVSNVLKSLDAQGGGSGPVSNILNESGLPLPGR